MFTIYCKSGPSVHEGEVSYGHKGSFCSRYTYYSDYRPLTGVFIFNVPPYLFSAAILRWETAETQGVSFTSLLCEILRQICGKVKDDFLTISHRSFVAMAPCQW